MSCSCLLQLLPSVRTALASSPLMRKNDYRYLAEEADQIFLVSCQYACMTSILGVPAPADRGDGGGHRAPLQQPLGLPATYGH